MLFGAWFAPVGVSWFGVIVTPCEGINVLRTYQRTLKYLSSDVSSLVNSLDGDSVTLSDPRLLTCRSGFRLAIGVDCTSGAGSSSRRGFLVGRQVSSGISVDDIAGFLIKGDLKGLKTMAVLCWSFFSLDPDGVGMRTRHGRGTRSHVSQYITLVH